MTPTTAAVIPESGAVNRSWPCVVSINGPPARMNRKLGRNVKYVATHAPAMPASASESGAEQRLRPAADEAHECDDHDERARRRLAEREPVDHLRRREPRIRLDRALVDIGKHRVRAAEGQQRGLREENGHLRQRRVESLAQRDETEGDAPQHDEHGDDDARAVPSGNARASASACRRR